MSRTHSRPLGSMTRSSRTEMARPLNTSRWLRILAAVSDTLGLEHRSQRKHEFIDLLFGDDEGRQHSQNGFVRAIENVTLRQKLFHDFFARNLQLDGQHQAFPAHFFHDGKIL